jgi:hypothetical protein
MRLLDEATDNLCHRASRRQGLRKPVLNARRTLKGIDRFLSKSETN